MELLTNVNHGILSDKSKYDDKHDGDKHDGDKHDGRNEDDEDKEDARDAEDDEQDEQDEHGSDVNGKNEVQGKGKGRGLLTCDR